MRLNRKDPLEDIAVHEVVRFNQKGLLKDIVTRTEYHAAS